MRVLRTPVRAPKANAVCERLGGSLRRECLDFLIPFNERHLQKIVREWTTHYNRREATFRVRPGSAGAHLGACHAHRVQTPVASRMPCGEEIRTGRLASRIWSREGGCVASDLVFAHYNLYTLTDAERDTRQQQAMFDYLLGTAEGPKM